MVVVQNGSSAPAKAQPVTNGRASTLTKLRPGPPAGSNGGVPTIPQMPSGNGKAALLNGAAGAKAEQQPAAAHQASGNGAAGKAAHVRPDLYIQLYLAIMEQQQEQAVGSQPAALKPSPDAATPAKAAADAAAEEEAALAAQAAAAAAAEQAREAAAAEAAEEAAAAAAQQAKAKAAAAAEQAKEAAAAATKAVEAASAAAKQAKEAAEAAKQAEEAAAAAAKEAEEVAAAAKEAEQAAAAAKQAEQAAAAAAQAHEAEAAAAAAARQKAAPGRREEAAAAEEAAAEAAAAAAAQEPELPREPYTLVKKVALAGGMLHVVVLEGDRMLRVWTPPGVDTGPSPPRAALFVPCVMTHGMWPVAAARGSSPLSLLSPACAAMARFLSVGACSAACCPGSPSG